MIGELLEVGKAIVINCGEQKQRWGNVIGTERTTEDRIGR
jgi:hypothetical protein